jgi:hypothetical protein
VYYFDTDDTGAAPADGTAVTNYGVRQHTGGTYDTWGSNYVWIEVIIGIPDTATLGTLQVTIYFDFQLWASTSTFA